jgi:Ca2+-binding RTX toxin-like protein
LFPGDAKRLLYRQREMEDPMLVPKTARRRLLAVAPAVLAAAALVAPSAQASRVSESSGVVEYDAGGGEANRISVTVNSSGSGRVTTTIADSEAISPSGSCSHSGGSRQVVTCNSGRSDNVRVDLDLGDRDDTLLFNQRGGSSGVSVRIADGAGEDIVTVTDGSVTWLNGPGNDIYRGGSGRDVALPGEGDDFILAGYGDDVLDGGVGNDQLSGSVGNDRLDGGDGFDLVEGNAGNDDARGGPDGDFVFGGSGNDRLTGDSGYDRLFGGPGSDTVDGSTTVDNRAG